MRQWATARVAESRDRLLVTMKDQPLPTLLVLQASPRGEHSISRALGQTYPRHWRALNPDGEVVERDLAATPVPYMDIDWIGGVYAPPTVERTPQMRRALELSAELIGELQAADHVLICSPMYNFTIPASLKSWIDYVVRPGFTFALGPGWPALLADRPVRVLVATRDNYDGGSGDDQVTPVLRRAFAFMGVRDVETLLAGGSLGVNTDATRLQEHLSRVEETIASMVLQTSAHRLDAV